MIDIPNSAHKTNLSNFRTTFYSITALEFATEGLKIKDPCPRPRISRDFKVKDTHIWKFQGISRTRVFKKFQGLKFLDLEIPRNSIQGWGISFQGFFSTSRKNINLVPRNFQGISRNPLKSLKHKNWSILDSLFSYSA